MGLSDDFLKTMAEIAADPLTAVRGDAYLAAERAHLAIVNELAKEMGATVTNVDGYDHFSDPACEAAARAAAESIAMYGKNYLERVCDLTELRDYEGNRFDPPQYRDLPG